MSVARHHAEWLSLIEVSGPFVSPSVLGRSFPQGIDPRDPAQAKALRDAYETWHDHPTAPGHQRAWTLHVLTEVLSYPQAQLAEGQSLPAGLEAPFPEHGETLRPDLALVGPAGTDAAGKAQLLLSIYPPAQALEKPVTGKLWKANPATRMMELLHAAGVPLGLITNGEQWMLVYAPRGETTGYASWYAALWMDEPITLRAFHSLLGVRRFFGVAADNTLFAMLKDSAQDQQEVTDQLGYQVREAVEVLVQSFDALDKESNRALLNGVSETDLYNAALTLMMRLVFLFYAEERGLLHLGKPLYDDNYAVSTLQEQLQETADRYGEEVLERRHDAWTRLLATFRAVHGGIRHQDLLMQAYGGSLFDPDRFPFLEGRAAGTLWKSTPADPLAVNNRVVLHLLSALQRLRVKVPGGGPAESRRISFRALGVEQIGHVYEGLLDHTARRAEEAVLGLAGTKKKEPELPLSTLEAQMAKGQDKLIEFLKDETGRSVSALRKALEGDLSEEHKLRVACGQDDGLFVRLRPFAGLIRMDSFERPVVVLSGSVYVTTGSDRRSTGTHYTPPTLTEPIVRHTLEPLVYEGPAEGWPKVQWKLRTPKELLALKVCDMAMGSGAFLVQACRYLAERLVEAWENEERRHPGEVLITPEGDFSTGDPAERLVPKDADERLAIARRYVADRCLYGVDINPMAVEMAKLSLWLITVDANRPFTFLDHAFKCGDSLLGVSTVKQIENFSLRPGYGQMTLATANLFRYVDDAATKRSALEELPSNDASQIDAKCRLYGEAIIAIAKVRAISDILICLELRGLGGIAYDQARDTEGEKLQWLLKRDADSAIESETSFGESTLACYAIEQMQGRNSFHWPLEYPEVFSRGGFDAFIGNPPFMGGKKISGSLGVDYLFYLKNTFTESGATTDLCAYFFRRAFDYLNANGAMCLIATNTIAEGDSRDASLGVISRSGTIFFALRSQPWPGVANLSISVVAVTRKPWLAQKSLEHKDVPSITPMLVAEENLTRSPRPLASNRAHCFMGTIVLGEGFLLNDSEFQSLINNDAKNAQIIWPYMNCDDLMNRPDQSPSRWVINFGARTEYNACEFEEPFRIVRERVKPQRDRVNRPAYRERWWQFAEKCTALYTAIEGLDQVMVCGNVAKYLSFAFVPNRTVFTANLFVFDLNDWASYSCLQSNIHDVFARTFSPTLETRLSYSPRDAFDPFPFPIALPESLEIGRQYHELRRRIMSTRQEGLTKTYNRFHNTAETSNDIAELRRLHVEMDQAVAAAYGWTDLDLAHGFHETKQGLRYTISETARREVLDRLLALNHQRYAEELAAGLHDKGAKKKAAGAPTAKRGRKKADEPQEELF